MDEPTELTRVTIVAGPPGAGKTTLVRERARWGDLVVDVDTLYQALSGLPWYEKPAGLLPFVLEARDAVLARLERPTHVRHAWLITSSGDRAQLRELQERFAAELVVLDTSPNECLKRIMGDERRAKQALLWQDLIARWWSQWQAAVGSGRCPSRAMEAPYA